MNIKTEQKKSKEDKHSNLPPSVSDFLNVPSESGLKSKAITEAISSTEQELNGLKDKLLEERFYWIAAIMLLVNIFTFSHMKTWSSPLAILILEIIILICLGRTLGVDDIWTLTEKIIEKWNGGPIK